MAWQRFKPKLKFLNKRALYLTLHLISLAGLAQLVFTKLPIQVVQTPRRYLYHLHPRYLELETKRQILKKNPATIPVLLESAQPRSIAQKVYSPNPTPKSQFRHRLLRNTIPGVSEVPTRRYLMFSTTTDASDSPSSIFFH